MRLYVGKVKALAKDQNDSSKRSAIVIHFSLPNLIENISDNTPESYPIAFPIMKSLTTPNVGDEVMIFQPVDDVELYYYFINYSSDEGTTDLLELRSGNTRIGIDINSKTGDDPKDWKHQVEIKNDNKQKIILDDSNNITIANDNGATISMSSNGEVKITNKSKATVTLSSSGEVSIQSNSNIKLNSSGKVSLTASAGVSLDNAKVIKFCSLPNCLFTGGPHTSNLSI